MLRREFEIGTSCEELQIVNGKVGETNLSRDFIRTGCAVLRRPDSLEPTFADRDFVEVVRRVNSDRIEIGAEVAQRGTRRAFFPGVEGDWLPDSNRCAKGHVCNAFGTTVA